MGKTILSITSITPTTNFSRSSVPRGGSRRSNSLFSLISTPNFKGKFTSSSSSSSSLMATPLQVNASSTIGASNEALDVPPPGLVGAKDLLIVGPGVLGRLVAEKWREEHPGCQIFGQTVTTNHHDELVKIGINPWLKETKLTYKFPYVIFCAPPSRTVDYPGDVRYARRMRIIKSQLNISNMAVNPHYYDNLINQASLE
ncbi:hypothetical protein U1Q18_031029 [Sarracenia purpurea var. burkii]